VDRDRDRDNFATMFDRHGPALYRYAYRRVGADAADDVVEESFVVAWRRRAELPDDPLPWLYRTAANVIANHHRSRARGDRLAARSAAQPPRLGHDPADRVALRRSLAAALGALSDRDREALLLVGWEDLDLDQAAAVAGCSVVAFRGRLRRARNRLRQHLRDAAVLPPGLVQNLPASTEGVAP
jgi:RNA polymerase sigma-70 factor (ECF subfamily)